MSKPISVLIVEDEFLTADTLKGYLMEFGYQISGMARDAQEALSILDLGATDFAILDMNIQGSRDGIWLAEMINKEYDIPFIFLTAYSDNQTVQSAVKTKPFGYLVKPFNKTDIYTALEVALQKFSEIKNTTKSENGTVSDPAPLDHLFLKEKNGHVKIVINDILYIRAESKYIEIFVRKKKYVLRHTLSDFLNLLSNEQFIQVHRSYAVNKNAVAYIGSNFIKIAGDEIPFSQQRKDELIKAFNFL
jgi:DNA-binding LytR/AlgR family response regulator